MTVFSYRSFPLAQLVGVLTLSLLPHVCGWAQPPSERVFVPSSVRQDRAQDAERDRMYAPERKRGRER